MHTTCIMHTQCIQHAYNMHTRMTGCMDAWHGYMHKCTHACIMHASILHSCIHTHIHTYTHIDTYVHRYIRTYTYIHKLTDRDAGRQTDRQTHKETKVKRALHVKVFLLCWARAARIRERNGKRTLTLPKHCKWIWSRMAYTSLCKNGMFWCFFSQLQKSAEFMGPI